MSMSLNSLDSKTSRHSRHSTYSASSSRETICTRGCWHGFSIGLFCRDALVADGNCGVFIGSQPAVLFGPRQLLTDPKRGELAYSPPARASCQDFHLEKIFAGRVRWSTDYFNRAA